MPDLICLGVMIGLTALYFGDLGLRKIVWFWMAFLVGVVVVHLDFALAGLLGYSLQALVAMLMFAQAKRSV